MRTVLGLVVLTFGCSLSADAWKDDVIQCLRTAEPTIGDKWEAFLAKATLDEFIVEHNEFNSFSVVIARPSSSYPDNDYLRCKVRNGIPTQLETRISGRYRDWLNSDAGPDEDSQEPRVVNTIRFADVHVSK